MRVLIAEHDDESRLTLEALLAKQGHEVATAPDGTYAWDALRKNPSPRMALIDWTLPSISGLEFCRRVRAEADLKNIYLILLTSRTSKKNLIEGLQAGANDFISKPIDHDEVEVRAFVGAQMVVLQSELAERVSQLEDALTKVKQLQGLLPICSYCKRIRDDQDYWHRVEHYIGAHSEARFSHGICPECWTSIVEPEMQRMGIKSPNTNK